MNILFLSISQFDEFAGGVDSVCVQLIRKFISDGHYVCNCFSKTSKDGRYAKELENCDQFQFPDAVVQSKTNLNFLKTIIQEKEIQYIVNECFRLEYHELCSELQKEIDFKLIYHCHIDPLSSLKALRDKGEMISFKESSFLRIWRGRILFLLKYPFAYLLRRRNLVAKWKYYYRRSDAFVTLSKSFKETITNIVKIQDGKSIYCITNPIESVSVNLAKKKSQVVFVGRLDYQKRVDRLLLAWKSVEEANPQLSLIIVGEGEAKMSLMSYSHRLNLKNVLFVGAQPSSGYIEESKALCLVSSYEGLGMTLLEAKARRTVPIAFDSYMSVRDIITNGVDGILVPPFSCKSLAESILKVFKDDDYYEKLVRNGLESLGKNSIDAVSLQWYSLFTELSR